MEYLWGLLIAAMKGVVCAVIYWVVFWVWAFFTTALTFMPDWLSTPLSRFGTGFNEYFKFVDVFVPLHEGITITIAYWTIDLSFRALASANSLRKI